MRARSLISGARARALRRARRAAGRCNTASMRQLRHGVGLDDPPQQRDDLGWPAARRSARRPGHGPWTACAARPGPGMRAQLCAQRRCRRRIRHRPHRPPAARGPASARSQRAAPRRGRSDCRWGCWASTGTPASRSACTAASNAAHIHSRSLLARAAALDAPSRPGCARRRAYMPKVGGQITTHRVRRRGRSSASADRWPHRCRGRPAHASAATLVELRQRAQPAHADAAPGSGSARLRCASRGGAPRQLVGVQPHQARLPRGVLVGLAARGCPGARCR